MTKTIRQWMQNNFDKKSWAEKTVMHGKSKKKKILGIVFENAGTNSQVSNFNMNTDYIHGFDLELNCISKF